LAFLIKIGFFDAAVVTARIKEGSVELHSMHCYAQVREETDNLAFQELSEGVDKTKVELQGSDDEKPVCVKCTRPYARVPGTSAFRQDGYKKETICPGCASKRVMFIRMFGHWPIQPFKELSAELQVLVWQGDSNNKDALHQMLQKKCTDQAIDEEEHKDEGSYLPKSVYKTLGYNTENIETMCPKKWDLELKEWTFKKTVTTDRKSEIGKKVKEELYNLRATDLRSKLSHYQSPGKKRKRKARARSSSSSSSKSSTSSIASSAHVDSPKTIKKKAAKAVKEAAEEAKIVKAKAAVEAKAARILALKQAKEDKVEALLASKRDAAQAKQAAKDPIPISMHMHIGTFYYSKNTRW
jgi:hypothetical protein